MWTFFSRHTRIASPNEWASPSADRLGIALHTKVASAESNFRFAEPISAATTSRLHQCAERYAV